MRSHGQQFVASGAAVLAAIGSVDAVRQDALALAALFVFLAALDLILLIGASHRTVEVRDDHHAWLSQVAAVTGESVDTVADRAVGAYRDARRT